uniref:Uncharacterized protein n=1 Tax=Amphimedon queenslandica TaxID=400682 RepID=A0A1X7TXM7_AMPQE
MLTLSFNSDILVAVATPLLVPMESADKKKLSPRSRDATRESSTIVIFPIPGRTRFLRISVPTGEAFMRHT